MDGHDWGAVVAITLCVILLAGLIILEKNNEDNWTKLSAEDAALEAFTHDTYYQNTGVPGTLRHTQFTRIDKEYVSTYTFNTTGGTTASAVVTVEIIRGFFHEYNRSALILYPDVGNAALIK